MNYAKGVCSSCKAITFKRNKTINTSGCLKYDPIRRVSRARKVKAQVEPLGCNLEMKNVKVSWMVM